MSRSMEFAKGLAGIYTGSSYNIVGGYARKSMESEPNYSYSKKTDTDQEEPHYREKKSHSDVPESSKLDYVKTDSTFFSGERFKGKVMEMEDGQIAWAAPWTIVVKPDRTLWIRKSTSVSGSQGGTAQLDLARVNGSFLVNSQDVAELKGEFCEEDYIDDDEYFRIFESVDGLNKSKGYKVEGKSDFVGMRVTSTDAERFKGEISQMEHGQISWATPWSIVVKPDGSLWISKNRNVSNSEGGTLQIDLAKINGNYFVNSEDVLTYKEEFSVEDIIDEDKYFRLFQSEDDLIVNEVNKIVESVSDDGLL